tara:strand:+ start:828 stop:1067 length:240 start_codon:yes stop_codon:yes gene_type:complete
MSQINESYEDNLQYEFKKSLKDTINTLNKLSKNIDDNLPNENSIKSTGDEIKVVENKLKRLLNKVDKSEYSKNFTSEEE